MKKIFYKLFFEKTNATTLQFLRYVFVGGFAAVVNIGSLYVFTEFFKFYYLISNIIGFVFGLLVNYIFSKLFVFTSNVRINKFFEIFVYCFIGIIGLGLDTLFMWIGTSKFGIYYIFTKIVSTGLVFIWNFLGRKSIYIIFREKKGHV